MKQTDIYQTFLQTVAQYRMLDGTDSVLIGFSGGADSAVMTELLGRVCRERGIAVTAFHLHHGIRGSEADRDAAHCRAFCETRGIPFVLEYADIPSAAASCGKGLEETARLIRRRALETYRAEHGISRIALAHNANDTLETMLFRLARGTSLSGLCGIAPVTGCIIRPMSDLTREGIEIYARQNGIPYVRDSTNDDLHYTRNYIRHEIVPRLCHVNAQAVRNAGRTARALAQENALLEKMAADPACMPEEDTLLARRVCAAYYQRPDAVPLSEVHIAALVRLLRHGHTGQRISLPGNLQAQRTPRGLAFLCDTPDIPAYDIPLSLGLTALPGGGAILVTHDQKDINAATNIYKLAIQASLDSGKIKGQFRVCSRNGRDTIRFGQMTRSVKKLVQSTHFSPDTRRALPLLRDDDGVIWLPSFPVCDRMKENADLHVCFLFTPSNEFIFNTMEI